MRLRALGSTCGLLLCAQLSRTARGDDGALHEGAPLFFISKSENRNQVAYAVRLDAECRPVGETPVYAYWLMLERSPEAVEPLLPREKGAYGLGQQHVVDSGESGGTVVVALRSLPDRKIVVHTRRQAGTCRADAVTRIADTPARLWNVHARLSWPFGVVSLEIAGWAQSDGHVVHETVHP
jgi:hypothetical protein